MTRTMESLSSTGTLLMWLYFQKSFTSGSVLPVASIGLLLVWLYSQPSFSLVTIHRCPLAVEENTQNYDVICSGIEETSAVEWILDIGRDGLEYSAGTCNSINSCTPRQVDTWNIARPTKDTSHILVKNASRSLYSSATVKCITSRGVTNTGDASCSMDITYGAEISECKIGIIKYGLWSINASCYIRKVFSSRNNYSCELLQTNTLGVSTSLGKTAFYPSLNDNNPPYANGSCFFTGLKFPTDSATYNYTFIVFPGNRNAQAGAIVVARPLTPNTTCVTSNIPENSTLSCSCSTQEVGKPGGRLMWIKGRNGLLNQIINVGSYDVSTLEMEQQRLTRNDDGTQFQCIVDWATNVTGILHTSNVNYGPDSIQIPENKTFYTNINGTLELRLICQAIAAKPLSGIVYSWTGPCLGVTNTSCTFRPHPGDSGISNEVKCTARNPFNNNFSREATFTVDLKYPPLQSPQITGYPQDLIIYAVDTLTLSCSINGGNPLASTTTLACLPYARNVSTGKTAIISFNVPEDVDRLKCNCSGTWIVPEFYPLSSNVQFRVYYKSYVSNLTLSGIPNVLIINESSSGQVQLLCVAHGRPTPEIRLIQEGQRELIRQIGGNIEKDLASLSYQVSSNCESTGRYNCETNNRIGEPGVAHVWLYVQCSPRSVSNTNAAEIPSVNFKGSACNISFDVISFPSPNQFSFMHKGRAYYNTTTQLPARSDIFEISCSSGDVLLARAKCTLTVDKVNDGDQGYYEVVVINSFGNTSFLFRLAINETEPSEMQKDNSATDDKTAIVAGVSVAATIIIIVIVVVTVFVIRRKRMLLNKDGTREPDRTQIAKIVSNVNDPLSQLKDTVGNTAKSYDSLCMQEVGISSPYDEVNRYELCSQPVNNQGISPISGPIYENNCKMEYTA